MPFNLISFFIINALILNQHQKFSIILRFSSHYSRNLTSVQTSPAPEHEIFSPTQQRNSEPFQVHSANVCTKKLTFLQYSSISSLSVIQLFLSVDDTHRPCSPMCWARYTSPASHSVATLQKNNSIMKVHHAHQRNSKIIHIINIQKSFTLNYLANDVPFQTQLAFNVM